MTAARPLRRLLDALIILAVAFALPIFWFMEKIIDFRGNGGDDENKNLRGFSLPPEDDSPPKREPPFSASMSGACCPIQHFVEKREEVD